MRSDGGYDVMKKAIEKLGSRRKEHIAAFGEGNERRLTGKHETTADINTTCNSLVQRHVLQKRIRFNRVHSLPFSHGWQGAANRGASIRVGRDTEKNAKGYFEDRRPASNMDPYVVTSMIAETTILLKQN